MTTLAAFLAAIAGSLAKRVLLALGISIFSYTAYSTFAQTIVQHVTAAYSGGGAAVQIANLAGLGECLGIMLAALTARAALVAVKQMRVA